MSGAKHTPGPWITEGPTEDGLLYVASVVTTQCTETAICTLWAESEADAQLIAAAPELLEALIDCKAALKNLMLHNGYSDHVFRTSVKENYRSARAILEASRKAIAKAEGHS